jgi:SAM-dependent methyltransferase
MRMRTVEYLQAPVTASRLELDPIEVTGDEVIAGRLIEPETGAWYRIEDGIADLVPSEYRNSARYEAFCQRFGLQQGPAPRGVGSQDQNTLKQIEFFSGGEAYEAEVVTSPFYDVFDRVTVGRWISRTISLKLRVAEVGCGSGRQTIPMLKAGADVVAVDLSEDLLKLARRKVLAQPLRGRADFVVATAENLPLRDQAFDAGLIFGSLHHFSDPPTAVLGIARTIRPGGRFYIMEPHNSPVRFVFDWMMRHWNLWREEANDDPLFTKKKFQTWLSAGGLDARICYSTYLPPHLFYLIDRRKGEWLLATTDIIFNSIPGLRRLGGVIIAEAVKTT